MIQVFQHSPLSDYIPHAFRPDNYISVSGRRGGMVSSVILTIVFPDILQRKGQFRIFVFDNSDFAESTFSDNSSEGEVIEAD
jgi:hypothetical protein